MNTDFYKIFTVLILSIPIYAPIFLPLFYWYILKKRTSKIFNISRYIRRFWAVLICLLIPMKISQYFSLPTTINFEMIGEILGQLILAALLWKRWKEDSAVEKINES